MSDKRDFTHSNRTLLTLVNKLCSSLIPNQGDNFDKICEYSFDLISQKYVTIEDCEEQYILSKIRNYFLKDSRLEDSIRFENLYHKLKTSLSKTTNPGELLHCLFLLSDLNNSKQNLSLFDKSKIIRKLKISHYDSLQSEIKLNGKPDIFYNKNDVNLRKNVNSIARPHSIHGDIKNPAVDYKITSKYNLLAKDLIFIFQGLSGKHLNFNEEIGSENDLFSANDIYFSKRLSVLGQHFKSIRFYSSTTMNNSSKGFVCQSFGSALDEEIHEFYKLITAIQGNFHNNTNNVYSDVTLHKLHIWTYETFIRFEALSNLISKCRSKKGGSLISVVYDFMHNGDPVVRECIRKILSKVVKPIRSMLNHWIFYGELKDEFKEFFIFPNENFHVTSLNNDFWHDKYLINKAMLPGFISKDQAYKILIMGKAISMLREVSLNKVTIILPAYDQLKYSFVNSNLETLFDKNNNNNSNDFASLLEYVYKQISQTALSILNAKYILHAHFLAHKRYLLFEQGDFINYLMELLNPIISNRSSSKIRLYTLSQTLENSIRKTSAQYDSSEILSRIDIFLEPNSQNEDAWDIFTLKYRIDGPISTIFNDQSQMIYSKIFSLLWKVKLVEFLLNNLWVELKFAYKEFNCISSSFKLIYNNFNFIQYQIISFIKTIQRNFNYLIESRWAQVKNELEHPRNLNKLIKAHQVFLQISANKLFFGNSINLINQYNIILKHIFTFIDKLESFINQISSSSFQRLKNAWGDEFENCEKEMDINYNFWLLNFSKMFHKEVLIFLELLVNTEQDDFQELCFSIDFNKYYKMHTNV